jgi:hypothetical protein
MEQETAEDLWEHYIALGERRRFEAEDRYSAIQEDITKAMEGMLDWEHGPYVVLDEGDVCRHRAKNNLDRPTFYGATIGALTCTCLYLYRRIDELEQVIKELVLESRKREAALQDDVNNLQEATDNWRRRYIELRAEGAGK